MSFDSQQIIDSIAAFIPNSSGDDSEKFALALRGNKSFIPSIINLANIFGFDISDIVNINDIKFEDPEPLKKLLDSYGSDKANAHNYHILYANILKNRDEVKSVIEIGLGTNNEDVISNMGQSGKPGASLRAFRDYLPNATIYGADVDRRVLFNEDRIETSFIDQLREPTVEEFFRHFPDDIDLIIDDGLHCPEANINVLKYALSKLKVGGWFVVEDIPDQSIKLWRLISFFIPKNSPISFDIYILSADKGNLFAVNRIS